MSLTEVVSVALHVPQVVAVVAHVRVAGHLQLLPAPTVTPPRQPPNSESLSQEREGASPLGELGAVGVKVAAEAEVTELEDRGHGLNSVTMVTL